MPRSLLRLPPKQCLPKMISYLSHKYQGQKSHDQIVAIAASECGVSRKNDLGLDPGIRAALHLSYYKEKYPHLTLQENLEKAYHKIMMVDDMVDDMLENGQEGTLADCLFQMAQDFDDMTPKENIIEKVNQMKVKEGSPKQEILKRVKEHEQYLEKSKQRDKERQKQNIKVYKIVQHDEFHDKCDHCGRQLKRALYTNQGTMGFRCYLTAIGIPTRKQNLDLKDLPDEAFEGVAEDIINEYENLSFDEKIRLILPNVDIKNLKFPVRMASQIHARWLYEGGGTGKWGKWITTSLIPISTMLFSEKLGIPYQVVDRAMKTKTMNKYYHDQVGFYAQNTLGYTEEELKKGLGKGWWGDPERHSRARKIGKADFTLKVVHDSFDELIQWVYEHTEAKTEKEAKKIAFAIINSRRKKESKSNTEETKIEQPSIPNPYEYEDEQASKWYAQNQETINEKRNRQIKINQEYIKGIDNTLTYLQEKLKDSTKGTPYYNSLLLEKKEFEKKKRETKKNNEIYELLIKHNIPYHFILGKGFQITGKSKYAKENLDFLLETKRQYEMLPAHFRTTKGAQIHFHKTVNGHHLIEKNPANAGGVCYRVKQEIGIVIATDPSLRPNYKNGSVIGHEKGHEEHYRLQDNEPEKWREFMDLFNENLSDIIRNGPYGFHNFHEAFADLFMERMTGRRWGLADESYFQKCPYFIEYFDKYYGRPLIKKEDFFKIFDLKEEGYLLRYFIEEGDIIYDGIIHVPEDMSFDEAEILIERGEAVKIINTKNDYTEDMPPKTASYRAPRAGSPSALVGGVKRTKEGQALKKAGIPLTVEGPEAVTLPFKIINTETGELVEGEMVENLDKGTAQMQPVSSSNVRSVGQAQNELVVAFHNTGEGRFYRYKFATPEMATEARRALQESPSPGRWIWHNIRGHKAGETITPSKLGPSITSGEPTIGGTTASLVQYTTSKTAPSRVVGYKEAYEKLKRETSNPATDPSTGARIEGLLGARKGFRELGMKIRQDHVCDFTMSGMLTRSGEFDYRAEGQGIKVKTPENLKWIAENTTHVPVFGKREYGSHQESDLSLIGFAHNFEYVPIGEVDDYAHVKGDVELFYDIKDLSDLEDPRDLPVSFGFDDIGKDHVQEIVRLRHLAVSLNRTEKDRCSTMDGTSCNISRKKNDMKSNIIIKPVRKIMVSLKK